MFESLKNLLKPFTDTKKANFSAPATGSQRLEPSSLNINAHYHALSEFNLGLGTIGPANRNDIDKKTLSEMYQSIASGEFNTPVKGSIPEICVDGRTDKDGKRKDAPSAAGGTLSIIYGSDLGGATNDESDEIQLTAYTIKILQERGHSTGVHGDDHSSCGCGACAKAKSIYQHITEHINDISSLINQYGIIITEAEKESIVRRAQKRLIQPNFFAEDRSSVLHAAQENGSIFEELVGVHNELGIVLNTKAGTTVSRSAIRAKYGPQYDMFVVDAWAFGTAAKEINSSSNDQDLQRITKAITVQNVATASILGHGSLCIIPIS